MKSILYYAGAGSGKTTKLVNDALELKEKKILIVTYTNANSENIQNKFIDTFGKIPSNIIIKSLTKFLFNDLFKPYNNFFFDENIKGIEFKSPILNYKKADDVEYYILNNKIYNNRLSAAIIYLNELDELKDKAIFRRLKNIYDVIMIDEVQDLAGNDLEIIKEIIHIDIILYMYGDPRQCTYLTHYEGKHKSYKSGELNKFLENEVNKDKYTIDYSLNKSYRNSQYICDYANKLYRELSSVESIKGVCEECTDIKVISQNKLAEFLKNNDYVQLIHDKRNNLCDKNLEVYNFGESKGLEFDNVLIFPTDEIWKCIVGKESYDKLKPATRAKFYVALTRARKNVVIVRMSNDKCEFEDI